MFPPSKLWLCEVTQSHCWGRQSILGAQCSPKAFPCDPAPREHYLVHSLAQDAGCSYSLGLRPWYLAHTELSKAKLPTLSDCPDCLVGSAERVGAGVMLQSWCPRHQQNWTQKKHLFP